MSVTTDTAYNDIASLTDFANSDNIGMPIWQSFTATTAEYLYGVQLYAKTPDVIIGGDPPSAEGVNVVIYDGTGTGGSVFTQLVASNVPSTTATWISFVFPSPFSTLTIGNTYTIAIEGAGANDFLWGYALNSAQTSYPGGEASFQPPSDLFFIVQVIPIPTNPNIPNTFSFVQVANGTAAAPSYTFTADNSTGIFNDTSIAPASVALSAGGTEIVQANANGFMPPVSDTYDLGGLTNRFRNLWIGGLGENFYDYNTIALTPTLNGSGADPVVTYGTQTLNYVRIGTLVNIQGTITWTATVGGAGSLQIQCTLPGSVGSVQGSNNLINLVTTFVTFPAGTYLTGQLQSATNLIIEFVATTSAGASTTLTTAALGAAGSIIFSGSYQQVPPPGP